MVVHLLGVMNTMCLVPLMMLLMLPHPHQSWSWIDVIHSFIIHTPKYTCYLLRKPCSYSCGQRNIVGVAHFIKYCLRCLVP